MAEPLSGEERFLTFRLKGQLYALPAEEVSEVIRPLAVARVPQSPPSLLGLGNLRGAVIPVASGRVLIGQDDAAAGRAIVLSGAAPVALAVDELASNTTESPSFGDSGLTVNAGLRSAVGGWMTPGRIRRMSTRRVSRFA